MCHVVTANRWLLEKKKKAVEAPTCFACICETLSSNMSSWWTMLKLMLMNNSSDQEKEFQPFTLHRALTQCAATLLPSHRTVMFINRTQTRPKRFISFRLSVVAVPHRGDRSKGHLSEKAAHTVHGLWPCGFCVVTLSFFRRGQAVDLWTIWSKPPTRTWQSFYYLGLLVLHFFQMLQNN